MVKPKALLNDFGEEFTEKVRDATIDSFELILEGRIGSAETLRMSELIQEMGEDERALLVRLVRRFIDIALNNTLRMIEESDRFDLVARMQNGELVSLRDASADGLTMEPYTEIGWFARHSKYDDPFG